MDVDPIQLVADEPAPAETVAERPILGVPRTVLVMSATHGVNDIFTNIYAPLLPLFIPRLGLSLAAAGTIAAAIQIAGSISTWCSRGAQVTAHCPTGARVMERSRA